MTNLRIVSLLPSATEIVHALGLGAFLVGRSHECDFPPCVRSLPICTRPRFDSSGSSAQINDLVREHLSSALSLYQVDSAALQELQPTHVITQTLCDVCAVSLSDVTAAVTAEIGIKANIVALGATALEGVWADIVRVASACGTSESGEMLVDRVRERVHQVAERAKQAQWRPRVAAIEWLDPLMAAGNWVPELLDKAGAHNLFGCSGEHSPWMKAEELLAADPDVIIGLPCGFDLPKTRREMASLVKLPGWTGLTAVRTGNVFICDGNQFMNRPGPRLVESLQIFGELLHPDLFAPSLQGIGWERF